jgi:hypothetical protein
MLSTEYSSVNETIPVDFSSSFLHNSKLFAEEQWQKAYRMLESNPRLMTSSILCMALKRRAPLHLIRFMLKLDPNSASIPREGPSPLQIAVQSSCSIEVIQELLEHCPFALVATNPGSHLDPLSYTKRFRPEEKDLIQLLSLPVSHWIKPGASSSTATSSQYSYKPQNGLKQSGKSDKTATDEEQSTSLLSNYSCGSTDTTVSEDSCELTTVQGRSKTKKTSSALSNVDSTELNNIKLICLSVLKGHRRLTKEMLNVQKQLLKVSDISTKETMPSPADIFLKLEKQNAELMVKMQEEQKRVTRTQLMALEMKEQAIQAQFHRADSRLVELVQKQTDELASTLEHRFEPALRVMRNRFHQFAERIESVEAHVREFFDTTNAMKAFMELARSSQHHHSLQTKKTKHKKNLRRIQPDVISPLTVSTATLTPSDTTFTFEHDFPEFTPDVVAKRRSKVDDDDKSSLPIMYATPFYDFPDDDDVRSLLTEETIVERAGHHHCRSRRAAVIAGKRWLSLLCNRQ